MYEFKFPDVGEGITEGELIKWLVKEGDHVVQDQPIAEVETDKAVVQIPSPVTGTVAKLHFKEGEMIHVGNIFVTLSEDESAAKTEEPASLRKKSFGVVGELEEAPDEEKKVAVPVIATRKIKKQLAEQDEASGVTGAKEDGQQYGTVNRLETQLAEEQPAATQKRTVLATPLVRHMAKELNIDISQVSGTGNKERIMKSDVLSHYERMKKETDEQAVVGKKVRKYDEYGHVQHVPFKGIRRTTALRLVRSWMAIPHVTHTDEIDVTDLVNINEKEKVVARKQGIKLTYLPFVMKAVIAAMKEGHPYINASLDEADQDIILKEYYNIGFAVDTPDGLIVPVVKGADEKSILDIAKEIQTLAEACRNRSINLSDLKGGTFTITNIGSLGGIFATPIINYPEAAILALGRIYDKPVFVNRKVVKRSVLPVSLTFDHRILDGAEAARFTNTVKEHLQDPSLLLIERD